MIKHWGEITPSPITGYTSFSGTHLEWETAERVVARARTLQIFNSFGDEMYRSGGEKREKSASKFTCYTPLASPAGSLRKALFRRKNMEPRPVPCLRERHGQLLHNKRASGFNNGDFFPCVSLSLSTPRCRVTW